MHSGFFLYVNGNAFLYRRAPLLDVEGSDLGAKLKVEENVEEIRAIARFCVVSKECFFVNLSYRKFDEL